MSPRWWDSRNSLRGYGYCLKVFGMQTDYSLPSQSEPSLWEEWNSILWRWLWHHNSGKSMDKWYSYHPGMRKKQSHSRLASQLHTILDMDECLFFVLDMVFSLSSARIMHKPEISLGNGLARFGMIRMCCLIRFHVHVLTLNSLVKKE